MIDVKLNIDANTVAKLEKKAAGADAEIFKLLRNVTEEVEASVKRVTPRKTGRLRSSVRHKYNSNTSSVVFPNQSVAPYCNWVIEGRGPVEARHGHYLHFFIDGQEFFRKRVKASKANDFVRKGYLDSRGPVEQEIRLFERWVKDL